jgi:flagellar flbD family protein
MIELTRLNGNKFVLNADLIEIIDANPDTVITLFNEHKFIVKESKEEVIEKVIDYKREAGIQVNIRKREV